LQPRPQSQCNIENEIFLIGEGCAINAESAGIGATVAGIDDKFPAGKLRVG
jgi:hypothetical protein